MSINREVVHEGWLIKSPPTKRIWRARWRRRWFTLRHSGELPGQFFLEYYTDRNCRKLKGTIDLDQCEQVDAGLLFEQRKLKYPFMFDIKTPSRVYYLAAESEQDMNSWVDSICQVCGLKAYSTDGQDLDAPVHEAHELSDIVLENSVDNCVTETPPLSPISGPYIPISECITGRPLTLSLDVHNVQSLLNRNATNSLNVPNASDADVISFILTPQKRKKQPHSTSTSNIVNPNEEDGRFYDLPRQLQPFSSEGKSIPKWIESNLNATTERATTPPLQSPTDSESVFTDDEWSHPVLPSENGLKEPRPSDSSMEVEPSSWSVVQRFGKLTVVDSPGIQSSSTSNLLDDAPPRPPKPTYLGNGSASLKLTQSQRAARLKPNKEIFENTKHEISNHSDKPQNMQTETEQVITDETYDFPRSHNVGETETSKTILSTRHCYNNAAPTTVEGYIFRYDIIATENIAASEQSTQFDNILDEEPASPCSQSSCSTTANYSNLPSPLLSDVQSTVEPPKVNRTLKPGRKPSDSASIHSLQEPSSPKSAPNVDRKLKPNTQKSTRKTSENEMDHSTMKSQRAAPSPTPPCFSNRDDESVEEQIYFYQFNNQFLAAPQGNKDFDKLQYLDLDLESDSFNASLSGTQPPKSPGPLTVYKTVDFVKTEAFKRTRQCVEAARKNVEP